MLSICGFVRDFKCLAVVVDFEKRIEMNTLVRIILNLTDLRHFAR